RRPALDPVHQGRLLDHLARSRLHRRAGRQPRPQVPVAAGARTGARRGDAQPLLRHRAPAGLRTRPADPHAAYGTADRLGSRGDDRLGGPRPHARRHQPRGLHLLRRRGDGGLADGHARRRSGRGPAQPDPAAPARPAARDHGLRVRGDFGHRRRPRTHRAPRQPRARPGAGPGLQRLRYRPAALGRRDAVPRRAGRTLFVGPVPLEHRESLYRQAWAFGRTLQVEDAQWPQDVEAFDRWWETRPHALDVDEEVRRYMQAVLAGRHAPWYLRPAMPLQRFVTRGLLPPRLRALFGLAWNDRDERRWQRFGRWAPRLYWAIPRALRHWPARYYLGQLRKHA